MAEVESLESFLRDLASSYSEKELKNVVSFTKNTLQGEFLNLREGNELEDVLNTMKNQRQFSSSNTELLKYFVDNAPEKSRKELNLRFDQIYKEVKKSQPDKNKFVGRHDDVNKLLAKSRKSRIVNIHGLSGVGKTTLAHEAAKKLSSPPPQVFSTNLEHSKDTYTIVKSVLLAFHSPKILNPSEQVVYQLVEGLKKKSVLILDNLELNDAIGSNQEERNKFTNFLKGISDHDKQQNLIILLTSKSEIKQSFVDNYLVEGLSNENSRQILEEVCPDEKSANQVSDLCQSKPLCLQATRAVLNEKIVNLEEIIQSVQKSSIVDNSDILLSKAFEAFSPDMKKVSIQLSLFQSPFTIKLAASLLQCSEENTRFYLTILTNRHFLTLSKKKYSMHSIAKSVITKKSEEDQYQEYRTKAQETFSRVFLRRAKVMASLLDKDYMEMFRQLQINRYNIDLAFKLSFEKGFLLTSSDFSENFHIALIMECLQSEQDRAKFFKDWSDKAYNEGNWIPYVYISCQLLLVLLKRTATKPEARRLLSNIEEALQTSKEGFCPKNIFLLAESSLQFVKGELAFADFVCKMCTQQQLESGVKELNKCLQTRQELLGKHTETARTLNALGNCHMKLNNHQKALEFYTQALDMRKELSGGKEHLDSPIYLNNIACVHEEMGKMFNDQCRETRDSQQRKQLCESAQSEFHQAIKYYQEAIDTEKKLFIYGFSNTATFYRNISNGYSYLKEYKQAFVYAKKALKIRKRILGVDVNTVRSYYQVGVAYERFGDDDKARKYYFKAYNMEMALPHGEQSEMKSKIVGKIQSLLSDIEEAEEFGRRTDEEVLTSDDEKDEEPVPDYKSFLSEDSSSDSEIIVEELVPRSKEPKEILIAQGLYESVTPETLTITEQNVIQQGGEILIEKLFPSFGGTFHGDVEREPEIIEECKDISVRHVIGKEGSFSWKIEDTGIVISFPPGSTPSGTVASCHVSSKCQTPLDSGETLISRVISLDFDSLTAGGFTIAIPHSGTMKYPMGKGCYEIAMKTYSHDSKRWKDVELGTFENIKSKLEYVQKSDVPYGVSLKPDIPLWKASEPEIVKFPSLLLKRRRGGTFCVISRLRTITRDVGPLHWTQLDPPYEDVLVVLDDETFSDYAEVSLKVIPIESPHFGLPIIYGPVIILSVKSKQPVKILKPVVVEVRVRSFLLLRAKTKLNILYKDNDAPDGKWIDATDDIPCSVSKELITMQISHFSMFWPVFKHESVSVQQLMGRATSLFSNIYGNSPVRAYFDIKERPNSRFERKTILDIRAMPWHLAPESESNSDANPLDKEVVSINLKPGDIRQYEEASPKPFTIRFDAQCKKFKGMHVDLHGNKKCIRSNCYFFGNKHREMFCDYPFTLFMKVEKVLPSDFFGIPFHKRSSAYKTLLEIPFEVLCDCKSTENTEFKEVIDETIEKERKFLTRESREYFYREIAHKDFENEAFDRLVSSLSGKSGLRHIIDVILKGKMMVMEPVDYQSINCILNSAKEDYNAFAIALGLESECKVLESKFSTSEKRFMALVNAWRRRDQEKATLHVLMKTLLDISCKDGVDDLVQRYEDMLENPRRPTQCEVTGHLRQDMLYSEVIAASESATQSETYDIPTPEQRPSKTEDHESQKSMHEQKPQATTSPDSYTYRRGSGISVAHLIFACLVLIAAIVIFKYIT